ncbi:hypothetical protein FEM48_Zijuj07G0093600 [Ziziphus jujuba var. spinosa]|uniref:Uncharacterized protein n=1 Tax=Ziziphus jujuba var. spinosa TaxID=714518 RepID=A0A978V3T7_ZIZJJ|nr:probable inactive histone-lysine N-methyltransferase SUVR2 isoform X1 [Ziziphus jujuba var. spinosa]KAH7522020.1 hypothetical protein FEM48_Zijuj07G0093600 [Ziziphus jujuba var. spinosa]
MAPNKKIVVADACRAMEQYGIPKIKTKSVMRELLKLYGTSWELIVQEGYKVLIDALFDKQEEEERGKYNKTIAYVGENSKAAKSKDKEVPHDKPEVELPSKRLRTRSQIKQALSQEEFAKSNLAKIGSEQKDQNVADFDSDTELEDPAPLVRTKCSRNQDELALVPMDNPVSLVVGEDELSWTYCMAEATQPPVSNEQSHSEPEVHLSTDRYRIKQDFLQEGYSKSCLPITASKSEHHNVVHLHSDSDSKVEDPEPLLRRKRSRHQNERALVSVDNPVLVDLGKGELSQNCCSEEVAEVTQPHVSDKKSPSTSDSHLAQQYLRKEGMTQSSPVEKTELSQTYPRSASPQCEEKNSKILEADCRDNTCNSDGGNDLTPATDVLDLYHNNSLDMLGGERFVDNQLKNEVPLAVIISDGSVGEVSQVEADDLKFLKTKSLDVEDRDGLKILESAELLDKDKVGSDPDCSKFNIASSPNGEVKIAFLCNSSQQSAFHVTSDAVLQVAEKRFIEAYRIGEPSFSLKKLMIELCECFLAMGNDSTHDELSVSKNLRPFQKSGADDILLRKDNFQGNHCILSCIPSEPFKFQNLIKVLPEIPKPMTSSGLEGLHCVSHSMVKDIENVCHRNEKRLKLLIDLDSIQLCNVEAVQDYHIYVDDIARGEERVKVTLENERNVDNVPSFLYISRNMVYDKACVNFALDSISNEDCCICCSGDCLTSPIPCACARKTGGGFAYTPGGLLKEKFLEECISVNQELKGHDCYGNKCKAESSRNIKRSVASKGHLRRKFIKECWSKCECSKNCGNRVVQRGMTVNLQVYWTPEGKGWGLRTLEHLPRGAFVCEYVGEIVTDVELQQRYMQSVGIEKPVYHVLLDAGYGSEGVRKDEESLCLDATYYGNVARFINHRCSDASLIEIPVEVETPDRSYYHVALFTTRKVNAMEELTWDYGIDFEHHNRSMRAFRCLCGSSYCRNPN